MRPLAIGALAAALAIGAAAPVRAEVAEVRIARQFSMAYLQFNVMSRHHLLEKQAAALGIPDLKVTWATFNGPDAMNDALVSGNLDFVAGGVPGLVTIWAKTRGTRQEVRGVSGLSQYPALLNSRNPSVKTLKDFTDADKIALPAVKVAIQAVILQMAAAQTFGPENYGKLDALTMSLSPPDATIGVMTGSAPFNAAFTIPPFQELQLKSPEVHTVLNSYDIGTCACAVMWGNKRFHDENPTVYRALVAALKEATELVNADKKMAAEYYLADVRIPQLTVDDIAGLLAKPEYKVSTVPSQSMRFAEFMNKVGTIRAKPDTWKDMFFPEIHDLPGS